jgi:hypothetical protein
MREFARHGEKPAPLCTALAVPLTHSQATQVAVHAPRQQSADGAHQARLAAAPRSYATQEAGTTPAQLSLKDLTAEVATRRGRRAQQQQSCSRPEPYDRRYSAESAFTMSPVVTSEREDWARSTADNLIGRGSEQRQVNGTAAPHTDHDDIGVPIGGHSKDFLIRLADDDRFVNRTTGRLVLADEFM